jgi:hypothetical protein
MASCVVPDCRVSNRKYPFDASVRLPFTMASPYLGGGAVNTNDGGVADALVGSDASGRLRLRDSSGSNQTYNSIGVSSTVTLNAQYRAA